MIKISNDIIENCVSLYNSKQHNELSYKFIELFKFFHSLKHLNDEEYNIFDNFIKTFLDIFIKKDFYLPTELITVYIGKNTVIAKLVAISKQKTTDLYISDLLENKFDSIKSFIDNNILIKVLSLYSSRNEINLKYEFIFFVNPSLASLWYWSYFNYKDYIAQTNINNFERHVNYLDIIGKRLNLPLHPSGAYYLSTYIHPEYDKKVKSKINALIKNRGTVVSIGTVTTVPYINQSDKKKIAIISGFLYPGHSVYKGVYRYIEALAEDYSLTMIHLGEPGNIVFSDIFNEVIYLRINPVNFPTSILPVLNNDYSLIFYPDIGMTAESIFISNLRLAPIQVTGHGHSVSTFGAEIDYFISGIQSEVKEIAKNYYSERLVLIPGIGLHPTYRNKVDSRRERFQTVPPYSEFIIICPWSLQKLNYSHLQNLKRIVDEANKKLTFIFFTSIRDIYIKVISQEISEILGAENIIVKTAVSNEEYMSIIEESNLVIDSFHFGGYNTVIDALFLNKLFVSLEGDRAYNKFASAVLRLLGLHELITKNEEEYLAKIINLINDESYYNELIKTLEGVNLKDSLFEADETFYFKKAIRYLIENHDTLKKQNSNEPIIIA